MLAADKILAVDTYEEDGSKYLVVDAEGSAGAIRLEITRRTRDTIVNELDGLFTDELPDNSFRSSPDENQQTLTESSSAAVNSSDGWPEVALARTDETDEEPADSGAGEW